MPSILSLPWRVLRRNPGNSLIIVLAIGLGVGLPATMFSLIYGIFLRPLPFSEGGNIVQVAGAVPDAGISRRPLSYRELEILASQQKSFSTFSAWTGINVVVSGLGGAPQQRNGAYLKADTFELIRIKPALGRLFTAAEEDPAAPPVVLVSHQIWRERYASDPQLPGSTIRINGENSTVIGVMPENFRFPANQDFWMPLRPPTTEAGYRQNRLQGVGRLAPGVSLEAARLELKRLAADLIASYPDLAKGTTLLANRYIDAYSDLEMRSYLMRMLAAVFGVYLIACANVSNLMLFRASTRIQELAIRRALGAARSNIVFTLMAEVGTLSLVGGLLGILLAMLGSSQLHRLLKPILLSFWIDIRLDFTVLAFTVFLTLLAALVSGILPAIVASREQTLQSLHSGSLRLTLPVGRWRTGLVVVQIALSSCLLVCTGVLIKSFVQLDEIDLGFDTRNLITAQISLPMDRYPEPASWNRFYGDLYSRIAALPEADDVTITTNIPVGRVTPEPVEIDGEGAGVQAKGLQVFVAPGFFDAFGMEIRHGRGLRASDSGDSARVAVINQAFADRFFANQDPLGRRLNFGEENDSWMTVVGVVSTTFRNNLPYRDRGFIAPIESTSRDSFDGAVYAPLSQNPQRTLTLALRGGGASGPLVSKLRSEVAVLDPDLVTLGIRSYSEILASGFWDYRLFGKLFAIFGLAALCLATIGLYGVMAISVENRTREIGVRLALGALPGDVFLLVLRSGLWKLALGLLCGLLFGLFLTRSMSALLYGVGPWDAQIFVLTAVTLAATGGMACIFPAIRATRLDPMAAIRLD